MTLIIIFVLHIKSTQLLMTISTMENKVFAFVTNDINQTFNWNIILKIWELSKISIQLPGKKGGKVAIYILVSQNNPCVLWEPSELFTDT